MKSLIMRFCRQIVLRLKGCPLWLRRKLAKRKGNSYCTVQIGFGRSLSAEDGNERQETG
jgi:hypothetical protein